jgi:uroporphyrinogen decarboxylase
MKEFIPDYKHIVNAARNIEPARLPLYEHIIDVSHMEAILGRKFADLISGDAAERLEFFTDYCTFFRMMGYDTVSYECCVTEILPDGGALYYHNPGAIKSRADFDAYPWDELPGLYFDKFALRFEALREAMPEDTKAIGGVGNGVFEVVQDLTGYETLCYIRADDEGLYADLFRKAGEVEAAIWKRFLDEFGDIFCVCRFGDDLGFSTATLLPPDDIRAHIIPSYKRVVGMVHGAGKPFLLHSCGAIFSVMDDLIAAGIDAKHSNEDQVAPFPEWVKLYGDRIGNFGGIDMNKIIFLDRDAMREYIHDVIKQSIGHGGFAFGSGNSIPDYVPTGKFILMTEIVREWRGEKRSWQ